MSTASSKPPTVRRRRYRRRNQGGVEARYQEVEVGGWPISVAEAWHDKSAFKRSKNSLPGYLSGASFLPRGAAQGAQSSCRTLPIGAPLLRLNNSHGRRRLA